MAECRSDMKNRCQDTMGENGCSAMGMGGMMGRGDMKGMDSGSQMHGPVQGDGASSGDQK